MTPYRCLVAFAGTRKGLAAGGRTAVLLALTVVAVTSASAPAAGPEVETRDPAAWPFAASSPWNTPLGEGARFASSSAAGTQSVLDPEVGVHVNAGTWSHPVVRAGRGDRLVEVPLTYVDDPAGPGWLSAPDGTTATWRVPEDAEPSAPGDHHLHVVDPQGCYVDETWGMRQDESGWVAGYHARTDLRGSGVGSGGARAYGGSAIGGLLREWEVREGSVRHALAVSLSRRQLAAEYIWPATGQDSLAPRFRGAVPMGGLLAVPPSVDLDGLGLSPTGLAVGRALQDYGAYVVDHADNVAFYAEPALEGTPELEDLRRDVTVLRSHLRPVTNADASHVGGPGVRVASTAPPLADDPACA
jgi:hypothetical protein